MTDDILNLDSPRLIIYKYARFELNLVQVTMCAHSCLCNTIIQVWMGVSSHLTFLPRNWTGWAAAGGSLKEVAAVWRRRNDGERERELQNYCWPAPHIPAPARLTDSDTQAAVHCKNRYCCICQDTRRSVHSRLAFSQQEITHIYIQGK